MTSSLIERFFLFVVLLLFFGFFSIFFFSSFGGGEGVDGIFTIGLLTTFLGTLQTAPKLSSLLPKVILSF